MRQYGKIIVEKTLEYGLGKAVEYLLSLILTSALAAYLLKVLLDVYPKITPYRKTTISLGAFACLLAFVKIRNSLNKNLPKFGPLKCDYVIEKKTVIYQYHDRKRMTCTRKMTIRAKTNIHTFYDRYCWSGRGHTKIRCVNPEHIYSETGRVNTYQLFEIKLGKTLKKGALEEIEVIWDLEDTAGVAEPFLATTIHEPTNYLALTIVLPMEFGVRKAIYSERFSSSMREEFETKEVPFSGGIGSISITKPKLLHYYELRWRF